MTYPAIVLLEKDLHPKSAELMRLAKKTLEPLVPPPVLRDLLVALDEAYVNILKHSYGGEPSRGVKVSAQLDSSSATLILQDEGPRGTHLSLTVEEDQSVDKMYQRVLARGGSLGLHFIRKTMSRLYYEVSPARGNTLYLIKSYDKESALEDDLTVEARIQGNSAVFVLKGSINNDTHEFLMDRILDFAHAEKVHRFLFDLEKVDYIASAGITMFINLYDSFEESGGRMAFLKMGSDVRHVINLTGFMAFFGDFQESSDAISWLG